MPRLSRRRGQARNAGALCRRGTASGSAGSPAALTDQLSGSATAARSDRELQENWGVEIRATICFLAPSSCWILVWKPSDQQWRGSRRISRVGARSQTLSPSPRPPSPPLPRVTPGQAQPWEVAAALKRRPAARGPHRVRAVALPTQACLLPLRLSGNRPPFPSRSRSNCIFVSTRQCASSSVVVVRRSREKGEREKRGGRGSERNNHVRKELEGPYGYAGERAHAPLPRRGCCARLYPRRLV